ncbi:MAG: hypothetical protein R3E95_03110 [Thiolinea sp.]
MIGITMGDPAGVGPEIIIRALEGMSSAERQQTIIYGNTQTLKHVAAQISSPLDFDNTIRLVDIAIEGAPLALGQLDQRAGDAAYRFICKAVEDAEAKNRLHCDCTDQQGSPQYGRASL